MLEQSDIIQAYKHENLSFITKVIGRDSLDFNENDIIFCDYNKINLIENIDLKSSILIIISGDNEFNHFNEFPTASKVYLTNINFINSRFNVMPFGMFNWPDKLIEISNNKQDKSIICYANFANHTHHSRPHAFNALAHKHFIKLEAFSDGLESQERFFNNIRSSLFNCCPRGNGIDTYRLWESIYMRSIPILQESNFAKNIGKYFHIFVTRDWNDFNAVELQNFYSEYKVEENINTLVNFTKREFYINDK